MLPGTRLEHEVCQAGAAARGPYLLPAMDLLNHSRASPATSLVDDDPAFVMVALRPIAAGEEVPACPTHSSCDLDRGHHSSYRCYNR